MRKRIGTFLLALGMACSLAIPVGAISTIDLQSEDLSDDVMTMVEDVAAVAIITDSATGSVQRIALEPESSAVYSTGLNGEEIVDVGYSVTIPIGVQTRADTGKETTNAGVAASLHVVYTLSSDKEQINITRLYGSWTPSSSLYIVSNRETGLTNHGATVTKSMIKYPASNSFSYSVSWGYQNFVTGVIQSPYAWSEATVQVSGMSGTSYTAFIEFNFPDSR